MKELTLLFLQKDDEVLLAMKKRGFGAGRWNGVGGKVEEGETLDQAVVRECQEEIGVTPEDYSKRAEIIFHEHHTGKPESLLVHVFTAEKWEGEPSESEEMAPEWFKISKIPYDEMWPDDEFWLPQVLCGKLIKATFELDANDQITDHKVDEVDQL